MFHDFWAKLQDRYGDFMSSCDRRRMRQLKLPDTGAFGVEEWREFRIKFMDIWVDMPNANGEETYQMVMEKFHRLLQIGLW